MKRLAILIALVLPVALVPAPAHATPVITITEYEYTPNPSFQIPFSSIPFSNTGSLEHTATQNRPFRLWNTGVIPAGMSDTTDVFADWAGTLPYRCVIHPSLMRGRIRTPVHTDPGSGTTSDTFDIDLADDPAPNRLKYEAQVRRNDGTWKDFAFTKAATKVFDPAFIGVYDFRSRVVHVRKDVHTGWSPLNDSYSQVTVDPV
ncbi:MAG: hypothetical protein WD276_02675 [Actinomycetota bacterium]